MSEKILFLGAGFEQYPIIERAKERGFYTIAIDQNPDAYGFKFADESFDISTQDTLAIIDLARKKDVDAITYYITETPLKSLEEVCSELKLPHPSHKGIEATVNKQKMRQLLTLNNIPNPGYAVVGESGSDELVLNDLTYPLIIKPTDKGGQAGLFKVFNENELHMALPHSLKSSKIGETIIEEYLEGKEINSVAIVLDGDIQVMTHSDRIKHQSKSFGVVLRHLYPSSLSCEEVNLLDKLCRDVVKSLNIKNGIIFPQTIMTKFGPKMVEIGVRVPGGIMKELFEYATGYDLIDLQIDLSLGKKINLQDYRRYQHYPAVTVKFLTANPGPLHVGKVMSASGIEKAREQSGIQKTGYFQDPREQEIRPLNTGGDRFYYVIATGDSREEVVKLSDDAAKHISFTVR